MIYGNKSKFLLNDHSSVAVALQALHLLWSATALQLKFTQNPTQSEIASLRTKSPGISRVVAAAILLFHVNYICLPE